MKRFAPLFLAFACGVAACWVYRDAVPPQSKGTAAEQNTSIDCSQEIRITRIHTTKHFTATLHPFHFTNGTQQNRLSEPPPDGAAYWLITFNGGTVLVNASQTEGD
jgi:hypothetical protein